MNKAICSAFMWIVGFSLLASASGLEHVKPIVDKAIRAKGDREKQKLPAITFDSQAKISINGLDVDFSGHWSVQGHEKANVNLNLILNGNQSTVTVVIDGREAWTSDTEQGKAEPVMAKDIPNIQAVVRAIRFAQQPSLLQDKTVTLSPLGELPVGKSMGVGVKIEQKGHRDVNLYFDKETGLPLKSEVIIQEAAGRPDTLYSFTFADFKEIDGMHHFTRLTLERDQKSVMEMQLKNIQVQKKLDGTLFAKP